LPRPVFELAVEHLVGDGEHVDTVLLCSGACRARAPGLAEGGSRLLGLGDLAQHRMGQALGVEHHRRGAAVEVAVLRKLLGDDLAPLAEAHQHVLLDRR
jgi:hypothetical protein